MAEKEQQAQQQQITQPATGQGGDFLPETSREEKDNGTSGQSISMADRDDLPGVVPVIHGNTDLGKIDEKSNLEQPEASLSNRRTGGDFVESARPQLGASDGLGDGAEAVEEGEQLATSYQLPTTEPKVSKPRKTRRSLMSNVVYDSRLLTGEQQKPKSGKQKTLSPVLTGEQGGDLKAILPELQSGFWWDAPANGKGYKINLRWRDEQKKQKCHSFRRLGKYELQTLRKGSSSEQRADITDWLIGELNRAGRSDLTARIKVDAQDGSGFSYLNSARA